MGRPPFIPAGKKARVVLSVLAGEMTIAEAARREKISEQSIGRWKADFLEAGKTALAAGKSGPSTREQHCVCVDQWVCVAAMWPFVRGGCTCGTAVRRVCAPVMGAAC